MVDTEVAYTDALEECIQVTPRTVIHFKCSTATGPCLPVPHCKANMPYLGTDNCNYSVFVDRVFWSLGSRCRRIHARLTSRTEILSLCITTHHQSTVSTDIWTLLQITATFRSSGYARHPPGKMHVLLW